MTTKTAGRIQKAVQCIDPDAHAASTVNGTAIDCRQHRQALFVLATGVLGASATIDVKIQESVDSGFSSPIDVSGAAFAQKVKATDDSKVWQGSVDTSKRLRYLRAVMVVGTATSDVAVLCTLSDPQKLPVSPEETDDEFVV